MRPVRTDPVVDPFVRECQFCARFRTDRSVEMKLCNSMLLNDLRSQRPNHVEPRHAQLTQLDVVGRAAWLRYYPTSTRRAVSSMRADISLRTPDNRAFAA